MRRTVLTDLAVAMFALSAAAGELLVVAADASKFTIVDRREVADAPTWAHVVKVDSEVYIRSLNSIARWQFK